MPIYEYLDSFAFIIIVKFEFPFNIDDYYTLGWAVQSSSFRVEKAHTAHIKWILYSLCLGIYFTQWVRLDIPDLDQYCEQFLSVETLEPETLMDS